MRGDVTSGCHLIPDRKSRDSLKEALDTAHGKKELCFVERVSFFATCFAVLKHASARKARSMRERQKTFQSSVLALCIAQASRLQ